ncbi:succinoglycan biosynthesis transport protein ExoP [Sphingomonas sp. SORGH_AS 950]|uniref:GNVR domain-containing protein n=1 Tax=unclassified Sphingomonas TaxID=196159 RepID=UPI00278311C5|nr:MULTISPECIES: GNVR domain-containing protein [unclassified Sphingomonas]MDQ1156337.1 succinoglycan biosynthesis transport protein ExoP [Sphingomonas sp. SORGH_AS_0950]MDR6115785.1 succinoglycan biosynthesis transport protein ExoP [Sphingomonas sp. SORGH_AS_0789]MDR6150544.1 succinoglycan biosynthesis transport protein ExoP [Sphingomonas sp. SORGH_AS_0742]
MTSFSDLLMALRHRSRLAIVVGGVVFALIAVLGFLQPRAYTASSSILIDLTQRDPTTERQASETAASVIDTIIGTQLDIIRSGAVLEEVARRAPPSVLAKAGEGTAESRMQRAVGILRRNLKADADKGSNVIQLSYTAPTPQEAAKTLNIITEVFLGKQVALRSVAARENAKWYDARTAEVRSRLEQAQRRLSDFQRQHGIVGVNRMDLEADKARSLSTELVAAQAAAAAARSKSGSAAQPEVAQSTIVQDLQREIGVQAGRVAELSKTLGPNHPDMVAANAQLAALRSQLGNARSVQAQALTAASSAAAQREATLRSDLAQQQARMVALSSVQDDLNVLQRDVDAARQTYDTVRQRFNEATLQSEISRANASSLDPAEPPLLPSKPNLVLWLIAAIILGAGTGLAAALGSEMLRPRLRTPAGTSQSLDLDVLADMTDLRSTQNSGWAANREVMA